MRLRPSALAALAAALLLAGCGGKDEEGNALMRPGENCLACHGQLTAAGTVYASATAAAGEGLAGVTVTLEGSLGSATVTTNAAGNFTTSASLGFPVAVTVSNGGQTRTMPAAPGGGCATAGCHGAAMRIHVP